MERNPKRRSNSVHNRTPSRRTAASRTAVSEEVQRREALKFTGALMRAIAVLAGGLTLFGPPPSGTGDRMRDGKLRGGHEFRSGEIAAFRGGRGLQWRREARPRRGQPRLRRSVAPHQWLQRPNSDPNSCDTNANTNNRPRKSVAHCVRDAHSQFHAGAHADADGESVCW